MSPIIFFTCLCVFSYTVPCGSNLNLTMIDAVFLIIEGEGGEMIIEPLLVCFAYIACVCDGYERLAAPS